MVTVGTVGTMGLVVLGLKAAQGPAGVVGLFVVGAAGAGLVGDVLSSFRATRRATLTAAGHPTDLVAGDQFTLALSIGGTRRRLTVSGGRPDRRTVVEPPASFSLPGVVPRRGVLAAVGIELTGHGWAGLGGCRRQRMVPLARPLLAGPRPRQPAEPFPDLPGGTGEGVPRPADDGDVVRGVREYVPGDPLRRVHWASSARAGGLVVREVEESTAPTLLLAVELGGGGGDGDGPVAEVGEDGEAAAGRGAWYALEALRRGYRVVLATVEDGRAVTAPAESPLAVNRRLALAGPGRLRGTVPAGWRGALLMVTPEGDRWD